MATSTGGQGGACRWPNLSSPALEAPEQRRLWHYLRQHPDVFMSELKEPHYFTEHRPRLQPVTTTEREYLRLFEKAGRARVVVEASPAYLRDPAAPPAIHRVSPGARVVVVVEHPVERAWSSYWHARRYGAESRSFEQVLPERPARASGVPISRYVAGSLYSEGVLRLPN